MDSPHVEGPRKWRREIFLLHVLFAGGLWLALTAPQKGWPRWSGATGAALALAAVAWMARPRAGLPGLGTLLLASYLLFVLAVGAYSIGVLPIVELGFAIVVASVLLLIAVRRPAI